MGEAGGWGETRQVVTTQSSPALGKIQSRKYIDEWPLKYVPASCGDVTCGDVTTPSPRSSSLTSELVQGVSGEEFPDQVQRDTWQARHDMTGEPGTNTHGDHGPGHLP